MCDNSQSQAVGCAGMQRMNRRRALQFSSAAVSGGLWLGGLGMTGFAEQLARAAEVTSGSGRPKSLLILWLQGGPSQLETFDPHPGTLYGGEVKSISTSVANAQIADTMPATAEQLHHACLVRSMVSKEGDHERATYHVKTGWRPEPTIVHPAIGSVLCYASPSNLEIPRHVSILASQWPSRAGYLGPGFDAFQIGDPVQPVPNLTPRVEPPKMERRLDKLLSALEIEFQRGRLKQMDETRTLHQTATKRAVKMMNSEQLAAFDVKQEGTETLSRFGDTPFGRGCLAGIRLLNAGVRCVEVELSGWDSHVNNHVLQSGQAATLDSALAATLQELAARDMLDDTIVFCGGEFGRTPLINPAGGRDHWPHGFSALLAGGRFRRGYVHGETAANPDRELFNRNDGTPFDPSTVTEKMVSVPDLHATLLHALDINYTEEHITPIKRPLRWSDGEIVPELLS